jgi:hypothetical protein
MLLELLVDRLWMSLRLLKLREGRIDRETRLRSRIHEQVRIAQALDVNHVCCMFPELRRLKSVTLLYPVSGTLVNLMCDNATLLHDATNRGYNDTSTTRV